MQYEQNLAFRLRRVGTRTFLIRSNDAIELLGIAEDVWRRLEAPTTPDEIARELAKEYDASQEEILTDVTTFVEVLQSHGAVDVVR